MSEGPLHILDADHEPVEENIEQLKNILQSDQYRDLPVKVVSVTGMMRCGKSTMLNLFMRQLRAHETTRQPIDRLDESLNNDMEPNGFPWGGGTEAVTRGVYIWSRPFVVFDGNSDKSAVLLMDVGGAFDGAEIEESAPAFAFAALVSSAILLNVERKINEFVIQLLDRFVATGNAPLQDVILVARDFTLAQTFGFEPGNELLKKKIKVTDSMDEAMLTSRERICQFVSHLSCSLLPHPGQQAAEQNDWRDARPEFLSCTSALLCAAIRHPKLVKEQPLKCADFVAFMEPLFPVIASDRHSSTTTLFDTMQVETILVVLRQAEDGYRQNIRTLANRIGLENAHTHLQGVAIEHLQRVQPPEVCEQLTAELEDRLEEIRADQEEMENLVAENRKLKIATGMMALGVAVATVAEAPGFIIGVVAMTVASEAALVALLRAERREMEAAKREREAERMEMMTAKGGNGGSENENSRMRSEQEKKTK